MPKCDMDCLNCNFEKCLDEMTDAERRTALGKGYRGRGGKKKQSVEEAEIITVDDPAEKERIRKELETKEKRRKYHAEYYQRNKEKMDARTKASQKKKAAEKKEESKKTFSDVAEELKELEEVKKIVATTEEEITTTKEEIATTKESDKTTEETADQSAGLITVHLTGSQAADIRGVIEGYIWDNSRDSIDMEYLCFMCDLWRKFNQ